jgi:hypothetical protein
MRVGRVISNAILLIFFCGLPTVSVFASPIVSNFTVTATSGPLLGTVASGTFAFNSSIIPVGGGQLNETGLLTDLTFSWGGIAFDALPGSPSPFSTHANTGSLDFSADGTLTGFFFGNDCAANLCIVSTGANNWDVIGGFNSPDGAFTYGSPSTPGVYRGTVTFTTPPGPGTPGPTPAPVPEPATVVLVGAGLISTFAARTRSRKGRQSERVTSS